MHCDDRDPDSAVQLGVCWGPHDAIQGVFVAALTLRQPMSCRQFLLAFSSAELPSRSDPTRRTTAQLVMHLLTELADATLVRHSKDPPEKRASVASSGVAGHEPSNVSDQPHDHGNASKADGSRFPPPKPTCSPRRCHDGPGCKLRPAPGLGDCGAAHASAGSYAPWRSQSPSPTVS